MPHLSSFFCLVPPFQEAGRTLCSWDSAGEWILTPVEPDGPHALFPLSSIIRAPTPPAHTLPSLQYTLASAFLGVFPKGEPIMKLSYPPKEKTKITNI